MSIPAFDATMFTLAADHLTRAVGSAPSGPLPDVGQNSQHHDWVLTNLQAAVSPLPTRLISSLLLIQFFQQYIDAHYLTAVDEEVASPDAVSNAADQVLDWYAARGVDWHRANDAASWAAKKAEWERKRASRGAPAVVVSESAPATVVASGGESVSSVLDIPRSASEGTSPATPVSVPMVWDVKDPSKHLHPGIIVTAAGSTEDEGEVEETVRPVKAELQVHIFIILFIFVVDLLYR